MQVLSLLAAASLPSSAPPTSFPLLINQVPSPPQLPFYASPLPPSLSIFYKTMTVVTMLVTVTALALSSVVQSCPPSEWAALMAFKASLNEPHIGIFRSWRGTNCCYRWYGVHCDPNTRRVVDITLRGLLDEPAFNHLNLTGYMSGSISPSICKLTQLSTLSISDWKAISGPIPHCIASSLPYLQILDLSGNVLSGNIPHDIGRLRQLTMLILADNHLSGTIPGSLVNLSSLTHLDLRNNALEGPIPRDIDRLRKLNRALLSHNRITGPIPWTISRIYGLADLDLSLNRISGRIPKALGRMPALDTLKLKYNKIRGGVPAGLLSSGMSHIDLSRNGLVGRIADVFHEGTYFINLDLSHNQLRGTVPKSMKLAKYIGHLDLSHNRLCGHIPRGSPFNHLDASSFHNNRCLCGNPLKAC